MDKVLSWSASRFYVHKLLISPGKLLLIYAFKNKKTHNLMQSKHHETFDNILRKTLKKRAKTTKPPN